MFFPSVLPFLVKTLPYFSPSLPAVFTQPSSPGLSQAEGPSLHSPSRAAPWVPLPPAAALFLLCCTSPPLLQQVPLPALNLSHLTPWGWHSDLPAHAARSPWSFSNSQCFRNTLVSLTCCLSFPICTAGPAPPGRHGCWWGKDRLDTFVAPHNHNCSHSVVLPSQACPRLIPDLLTAPHGCGAAHSWVQVAPFLCARHTQLWDAQRGTVNPLSPADTRGWLSHPFPKSE